MSRVGRSSISLLFVAAFGACLSGPEAADPDPEVGVIEQGVVTPTPFVSEEDGQADWGGVHCPEGKVAMGYECIGGYCDSIRLLCDTFPGTLGPEQPWTPWFSEETVGRDCTGLDEWVTGIQCRGGWCDDMRFTCRKATQAGVRTVERNACGPVGPISEEQPPISLEGMNRFLGGLTCTGWWCDNVSARACSPQVRCEASLGCGFNAAAACQCDAACTTFGDCCANKVSECGP
jgi:hypothetical protein